MECKNSISLNERISFIIKTIKEEKEERRRMIN